MEFNISTGQLFVFCKNNWFKLTVVALCLYIYFGKDFSLNLQVKVPEDKLNPASVNPHDKMTENSLLTAETSKLEVPFLGSTRPPKRNPKAELAAVGEEAKQAYLKRFANVAMQEQEKYGIPASVILGTALYQSLAGERDLARQAENHFALSCDAEWRSACQSFQGKSYRKYETAWASFRDFSEYAVARFGNLRGSGYSSWAMGMQKNSFNNDGAFAKTLIEIIEKYSLHELDG